MCIFHLNSKNRTVHTGTAQLCATQRGKYIDITGVQFLRAKISKDVCALEDLPTFDKINKHINN